MSNVADLSFGKLKSGCEGLLPSSYCLGPEWVLSLTVDAEGRDQWVLILAEIHSHYRGDVTDEEHAIAIGHRQREANVGVQSLS